MCRCCCASAVHRRAAWAALGAALAFVAFDLRQIHSGLPGGPPGFDCDELSTASKDRFGGLSNYRDLGGLCVLSVSLCRSCVIAHNAGSGRWQLSDTVVLH